MGNSEGSLRHEGIKVDYSKGQVHEDWTMSPGKLHDSSITVFSASHPSSSRKRPFMEKALQWSKVLRHPNLLRYIYGGLGNEVIIVTEKATPLIEMNVDKMAPLQVTAGIFSIVEALIFLHDKAGISHNNVCASSIFVTPDGTWKLWGMEYLCSFGDLTKDHLTRINPYCNSGAIPPDELRNISPSYQHSRDSFAMGKFIKEFAEPVLKNVPHFDEFAGIIDLQALSKDWTKRPRMITFSSHSLFSHDFIQLRNKIANILLLPSVKRDSLLRSLPEHLKVYEEELVASTMGAMLVSHALMLIPGSDLHLMPYVLKPKNDENPEGLFSSLHYTNHLVAPLLHLFTVHDCTIRKILLQHFKNYAHLINNDCLRDNVLPELLLGMKDKDEQLVAMTLMSLAHLISILGADTVVGQNRENIFATAKPKSNNITKTTGLKLVVKRKESLSLALKSTDFSSQRQELCSSPVTIPSSLQKSPDIPVRSSPDGGEEEETQDASQAKQNETIVPIKSQNNKFNFNDVSESNLEFDENCSDVWSDWEEMLDQSVPDINGVLQVMTPEKEHFNFLAFQQDDKSVPCKSLQKQGSLERSSQNTSHSAGKRLKAKDRTLSLGEEYDIMSLNVKKIPDAELSLFESIAPILSENSFDLEKMLVEATKTSRLKFHSLSDTLAELEIGNGNEGDGWDEEKEDKIFDDLEEDQMTNVDVKSVSVNFGSNSDKQPKLSNENDQVIFNEWDENWS